MRWLTRLFKRQPQADSASALWLYVACGRCGEAMRTPAGCMQPTCDASFGPAECVEERTRTGEVGGGTGAAQDAEGPEREATTAPAGGQPRR